MSLTAWVFVVIGGFVLWACIHAAAVWISEDGPDWAGPIAVVLALIASGLAIALTNAVRSPPVP